MKELQIRMAWYRIGIPDWMRLTEGLMKNNVTNLSEFLPFGMVRRVINQPLMDPWTAQLQNHDMMYWLYHDPGTHSHNMRLMYAIITASDHLTQPALALVAEKAMYPGIGPTETRILLLSNLTWKSQSNRSEVGKTMYQCELYDETSSSWG